jgi:hypothetical protein
MARGMTSTDIFDAGYAVMLYDIAVSHQTWRFRDTDYRIPAGAVPYVDLPDLPFRVARAADVIEAAALQPGSQWLH